MTSIIRLNSRIGRKTLEKGFKKGSSQEIPRGFQPLPLYPKDDPENSEICEFSGSCNLYGTPNYKKFCWGADADGIARCVQCHEYSQRQEILERYPDAKFFNSGDEKVRVYVSRQGKKAIAESDLQEAVDEGNEAVFVIEQFKKASRGVSRIDTWNPISSEEALEE
jgi:hypothetical protein